MGAPSAPTFPVANIAVSIPNGASVAASVYIGRGTLIGVLMPAAWTAANLTFQVSQDGVNFSNLFDASGNEVIVTAAASRFISMNLSGGLYTAAGTVLSPIDLRGALYIIVRSGTSGTPVNQGAARALTLVVIKNAIGL